MIEERILVMTANLHWIKHSPIQTRRFTDSNTDSVNKRGPNLVMTESLTNSYSDLPNEIRMNLCHNCKDSPNQTSTHQDQTIHWFTEWQKSEFSVMTTRIHRIKQCSIQTKRFTDSLNDSRVNFLSWPQGFTESNTNSVNERAANLGHDHKNALNQKIHRLKHSHARGGNLSPDWKGFAKSNNDPSKPKDSLIQTLIHWMKEQQIFVITERLDDSKTDSLNQRGVKLACDLKVILQNTWIVQKLNDFWELKSILVLFCGNAVKFSGKRWEHA